MFFFHFQESLRKYPPVPLLDRVCIKDYKIPDSDVILKKGTQVLIPILGIQNDPEYYPNPEVFDPDRFSTQNKSTRPQFTYLPFGDGPRNCIGTYMITIIEKLQTYSLFATLGLRFAYLQNKIGLITILKHWKVVLNSQTVFPLQMDARSWLILINKDTIWLDVVKVH